MSTTGRWLQCTACGAIHQFSSGLYCCPTCSGILEVRYHHEYLVQAWKENLESTRPGIWKHLSLLPLSNAEHIITLSEGDTPLAKAIALSHELGVKTFVKDETRNPTGSFKDRPNSVAISKALELGAKTVALASSGNAAGSLSAYAAKAGVVCVVAVPEDTPHSKLGQILVFGSRVTKVRGTYSDAFKLIKEACKTYGWHNLTSVASANPYQVEGDKTVAYEMCEQLAWTPPDWVAIPLGAGPLLVGVWKGFKELYELGVIGKLPKMIGVQAEGCSPIVRAFKNGKSDVSPWEEPHTLAHSIADPLRGYSEDGTLTLKSVHQSGGIAESVTDEEMLEAVRLLARTEGLFAEPSAAAAIAVVKKLRGSGSIKPDDIVVPVVTGTGLKSMETLDVKHVPEVDPDDIKGLAK
jgi:threonine synthase